MKFCPRCKIEKANVEFCKNKSKGDGLASYCKICICELKKINKSKYQKWNMQAYERRKVKEGYMQNHCQKQKVWKKNNRDKIKNYYKKWASKNSDFLNSLYKNKVINLKRSYILSGLYKQGYSKEYLELNPELIEIQKTIIKIKRKIKQNGKQNTEAKNIS